MAIGKKRSGGSARGIGSDHEAAKNARRQQAVALAQKAATENAAANRQLETARANAAPASLVQAHAPSMTGAKLAASAREAAADRAFKSEESEKARQHEASERERARQFQREETEADRRFKHDETSDARREQRFETERDRRFKSTESERARQYDAAERERQRRFAAGESASDRDLRLSMMREQNANDLTKQKRQQEHATGLQDARLRSSERVRADANASAERRAKINALSRERIERSKGEFGVAKEQMKGAQGLAKERLKGENDANLERLKTGLKISADTAAADRDLQKWYKQQDYTNANARIERERQLVDAGTHEWGYTDRQKNEIDQLEANYDEQVKSGRYTPEELKRARAEIDQKIEAMPMHAVKRTDAEAMFRESTYTDGDGRIFDRKTNRLVYDPVDAARKDRELELKQSENEARRSEALRARADNYRMRLENTMVPSIDPVTGMQDGKRPRTQEEIDASMRAAFPSLYQTEAVADPNGDEAWINANYDQLTPLERAAVAPNVTPAAPTAPMAGMGEAATSGGAAGGGISQTEAMALLEPRTRGAAIESVIADMKENGVAGSAEEASANFANYLVSAGIQPGSEEYDAIMAQFESAYGGSSGAAAVDLSAPAATPAERSRKWSAIRD